MLDVECKERFAQAMRLAIDGGCLAAFARPLLELDQAAGPRGHCVVRAGAAPLDFAVAVFGGDGVERFGLALAYTGPGLPGAGAARMASTGDAPLHRWTPVDLLPAAAGVRTDGQAAPSGSVEVRHA